MIVNWIFLGFYVLVEQKKQFEEVTVGPEDIFPVFSNILYLND